MGYRRRRRRCRVLNDFYETACCKFYRREHLPLHCTVLFFHPTYIIMAGFLLLGDGGICITHKQGLAFRRDIPLGFSSWDGQSILGIWTAGRTDRQRAPGWGGPGVYGGKRGFGGGCTLDKLQPSSSAGR